MKNNLQKLRWERNLSQAKLSLCAGVKQQTISKIENHPETNPSIRTVLRLAHALNVPVDDIFSL